MSLQTNIINLAPKPSSITVSRVGEEFFSFSARDVKEQRGSKRQLLPVKVVFMPPARQVCRQTWMKGLISHRHLKFRPMPEPSSITAFRVGKEFSSFFPADDIEEQEG